MPDIDDDDIEITDEDVYPEDRFYKNPFYIESEDCPECGELLEKCKCLEPTGIAPQLASE